ELPRLLDTVAPREQRRIAAHAVEQEPLVGFRQRLPEGARIAHVHQDVRYRQMIPGHLRDEAQRHPFVRLDAEGEDVGLEELARLLLGEQAQRDTLEYDRDFGHAGAQSLAGPTV